MTLYAAFEALSVTAVVLAAGAAATARWWRPLLRHGSGAGSQDAGCASGCGGCGGCGSSSNSSSGGTTRVDAQDLLQELRSKRPSR